MSFSFVLFWLHTINLVFFCSASSSRQSLVDAVYGDLVHVA